MTKKALNMNGIRKWHSFTINEFISLKLVNKETIIFVDGEEFSVCKYLLLNLERDNFDNYSEIVSIDDASLKLSNLMENNHYIMKPEVEFMGHCSNLQAWAENDYNTCLLHRNLAFPLLKKLSDVGDLKAKKVFKKEIIERTLSNNKTVITYLMEGGYYKYFTENELQILIEDSKIRVEFRLLFKLLLWEICPDTLIKNDLKEIVKHLDLLTDHQLLKLLRSKINGRIF